MVTETEYRQVVNGLTVASVREVGTLLDGAGTDPARVRDLLIDYLPSTVSPYLTTAGEVAATWYEELIAQAGVNKYAQVAPGPDVGRFESLARWGVRPLAGQSSSTVLSLVGGGVQRMIANAGRDTIDVNAKGDAGRGPVAAVAWSRVTAAGACDFCTMLAGRGAVYRSAESAGAAIAGGSPVSGLGSGMAKRFHDHCHCVVKPTFYQRSGDVLLPIAA